jgi:hypothetical protein
LCGLWQILPLQPIVPLARCSDEGTNAMDTRLALALAFLGASHTAAPALDPPVVWRDSDTGCAYFLTPQGGVTARYLRNGLPDCPDANASSRLVDDTARGISRGLETLQRELERLRERFRDQPSPERLERKT